MWRNDVAGIVCQALQRPSVHIPDSLFAAFPSPASAARLNQSAAAA